MKKIICLLFVVIFINFSICTAESIDEDLIRTSFEKIVKKHIDGYKTDPRIMVYYIPNIYDVRAGWRKSKCIALEDYLINIEETGDINSPYTAQLIFKLYVLVTPPQQTKEIAENTEVFMEKKDPQVYRITFSYKDGTWIAEKYESQYRVERSIPPFWRAMENVNSSPYKRVAIKEWE